MGNLLYCASLAGRVHTPVIGLRAAVRHCDRRQPSERLAVFVGASRLHLIEDAQIGRIARLGNTMVGYCLEHRAAGLVDMAAIAVFAFVRFTEYLGEEM